MSIKINVTPSSNIKVSTSGTNSYSIKSSLSVTIMPQRLNELSDVDITGDPDNYVLMYDAATSTWKNRNPDEVLIAATEDNSPGYVGLPSAFENQLDVDLDNKIDLDAGEF
jgi:hypothetical protein